MIIYQDIKHSFKSFGYQLLSNNYINAYTKLDYICSKGHKHFISWSNWQQGKRCPYCYGNVKSTIGFIRKIFRKEGYRLLTKEYKNCEQKLNYVCPKGHRHSISWSNWQRGHRCPYCVGQGQPTMGFIESEFKREGYILLSTEYINNHSKLDYICPKGHRHSIKWNKWQQGRRCPSCYGNTKPAIEFIKSEFEKEGYTLLSSEYKNNRTKLGYICPKGHKHSISWGNWQRGHRCGVCKMFRGFGEQSGFWKGGVSCNLYCDIWSDREYKESIKERDGHRCLNPDCRKNCNHLPLTIHHIDYNKKNCGPENLITLCSSCNSRANMNREWHKSWYNSIMRRRYYLKG
jgi:hypothetical protein